MNLDTPEYAQIKSKWLWVSVPQINSTTVNQIFKKNTYSKFIEDNNKI